MNDKRAREPRALFCAGETGSTAVVIARVRDQSCGKFLPPGQKLNVSIVTCWSAIEKYLYAGYFRTRNYSVQLASKPGRLDSEFH